MMTLHIEYIKNRKFFKSKTISCQLPFLNKCKTKTLDSKDNVRNINCYVYCATSNLRDHESSVLPT